MLTLLVAALLAGCRPSRPVRPSNTFPAKSPDPAKMALDTLVGGARVYRDVEVDTPAIAIFAPPHARYPTALKSAGRQGGVEFAFVVDTAGAIEPSTIHLISSSHPDFTAAVRAILASKRFIPAVRGRQRVRMWVSQEFEFRLAGLCFQGSCSPPPR